MKGEVMSAVASEFSHKGFVKTFVMPALLVFLVPALSLFFFLHAQSRYNAEARETVLKQIAADATLSDEERQRAVALFTEVPFSRLMKNPAFAADMDRGARFDWATFRWMIRLGVLSIVSGVLVFLLAGVCVLLSSRSQRAQYLSLATSWHVLRIYGALQVLIQGTMLVALSYWVTALWMNMYVPKLILVVGIMALAAVGAILKAIFTKPPTEQAVEGKAIDRQTALPLWNQLNAICTKVGTAPPDQVVAGIDDNFFVTEMPVVVDGKKFAGRTLYVSLSLLKQMNGSEADAVLAHEMAHFHGQDTLYSKKISPLLVRYGAYLQALHGTIAQPIYYFMNCFRALFELSLGRLSRQREFRADALAAQVTSPMDVAGGLLRVASYAKFRGGVQEQLFKQERALESANISERLAQGYVDYAVNFTAKEDLKELKISHPFDSHPPIEQRLAAMGLPLDAPATSALLATAGDGRWYDNITGAEEIEHAQWSEFEQKFRDIHEQTLAYRFLPFSEEEREIVEKAFPPCSIEGKKGSLALDCERLMYTVWTDPVFFREITGLVLDGQDLQVHFHRDTKQQRKIPTKTFDKQQQEALEAVQRYYGRYKAAEEYQKQKLAAADGAKG